MANLTDTQLNTVMESELFSGLSADFISAAVKRGMLKTLEPNVEYRLSASTRIVSVLLSGEAEIYKRAGESSVLMSVLRQGSVTGAATVFAESETVLTSIRAHRKGLLLCFDAETVERLMQENFEFAKRYLAYLSGRIRFLVARIESIACPTAKEKLYNYLIKSARGGKVELAKGMSGLASTLGISRASLYRVMEELEHEGFVKQDGRTVFIV